ncbi:MAG: HD domain-containing protein [Gammaproteobacteria bacterium]|nr:HD domain-containing protein [Gammaproteobacteria bacterium]
MKQDKELKILHSEIKSRFRFLTRISVCLYNADTDIVKTYLSSSVNDNLGNYSRKLAEIPTLLNIAVKCSPRVINDIEKETGPTGRLNKVLQGGYKSSYTIPMLKSGEFFGFIFFNSDSRNSFSNDITEFLNIYGRLIAHYISCKLQAINSLTAAVKTMKHVFDYRDSETSEHLNRMSHYSWLIARKTASKYSLSDEWIEHLLLFSPLHDVGKIAIPDYILFKPGKLTTNEFNIIKTHATKGREIIEKLVHNFNLIEHAHINMLLNIVEYHHESVDGTGYPEGLSSNEIPLEARIVAVADVFDALTSDRPYKIAMSNDQAFEILNEMSGKKLDSHLVEAFIECIEDVETYQFICRAVMSSNAIMQNNMV